MLVALLPSVIHTRLWTFWPVFLAAFVLAMGLDYVLAPSRRRVQCDIKMPDTLFIGDQDEARVRLFLPTRRPVPVQVAVDLSDNLVPQRMLRGRASQSGGLFRVDLIPTRRGTISVDRVWARYSGPLGLLSRQVKVPVRRHAAVVPNIRPVKKTALRFFVERDFRAGLKIEKYSGDGTEFDSLREYHVGDDNRSIDWKSTARHKKLVARQFRAERNHQIILAVDTGHLMAEPLQGIPKLDHAINATLLLSYLSLRAGDRVGLYTFGSNVGLWLQPQGSVHAHKVITQLTGEIEYSDAETNFTLGLTSLATRLRRRSLVIVMTDFVDTVTAELMLENIDRLAKRHVVIFVGLRDPGLVAIANQEPSSRIRLNQAVVADSLLRDRYLVFRRLQRMGVYALDEEPKRVSSELINTYLDIKRRERI